MSGGSVTDDGVNCQYNKISFSPRDLGTGMGYVIEKNKEGTTYVVETWMTGLIGTIQPAHGNKQDLTVIFP